MNEEDHTVEESEYPDFRKWNIPKVSTKSLYELSWFENTVFSKYRVRTIEQTFSISRSHEKCCLFSRKNINDFMTKKLKYLHIGLVQVAVKPLTRKGINASVLMCLRDARFKRFNDSILGMIIASLYDDPIFFDCYHDLALAFDDPNIIKALTLYILTSGYDMDEGSKPFTLIYRIYYRLLDSQLTPRARGRDPVGKTMLIQYITLPKEWTLEQESPPVKPVFDELDLTNIQQYADGTVKICFGENKPLRINEGRHSFVGSETESPSTIRRDANEEEDDAKSDVSSGSDFPPIETPIYQSQSRVLTRLEPFEIDIVALYNEFISTKNRSKRKKSNFVKEEKTVVRSSHPPIETVLITHQNPEVKASPFKIVDDSIIEQKNFANESLHVIGQQLDCIEEKIVEKTSISKLEKPLIDLLSQREKPEKPLIDSKTLEKVENQSTTLEKVEKMLANLKVKTEKTSTFRNAAWDISRNEKEIVSDENIDSDSLSSVSYKNFEERSFQTQFSVSVEKLYEWNIDGLFEQEIINKMARWWDSHLTEESKESIKHSVKKDNEGMPIFYENINRGIPDGVNTLVYTILKHFVGTPSNVSSQISDYLNNLRCPTMSDYRWYQDVFISRVMLRKDSTKPYWKERFIDGLPPIFAYKVKQELIGKNDSIDYDNLTYGDIFSTIKKLGINMCNDEKLLKQQLKNKKKAKYEMGNFYEQYGLPPIAPSRQK
ncbi:hypothetical protein ACB092_09G130500 [Castanea dentata]